jgi:hypothetical protein
LIPLPRLTLLFPALSPTPTPTLTSTLTWTPTSARAKSLAGQILPGPRFSLIGGLILLIWLALGGFLIVYLRRLGY